MNHFNPTDNWATQLPNYLTSDDKKRLQQMLSQFKTGAEIDYTHFYPLSTTIDPFFLQGDLLTELPVPIWDDASETYTTQFFDCMIISNSCDISESNNRSIHQKQCLIAPLLDFDVFLLNQTHLSSQQLDNFKQEITRQQISNLFYLPPNPTNQKAYLAQFDKISWFPVDQIHHLQKNINEERITTLNLWGFYLFVNKLSFHFCRLPEEKDRNL